MEENYGKIDVYKRMRVSDINEKLSHVSRERQRLMNILYSGALKEGDTSQVRSIVADILGNMRKCFDYAARDIVESVFEYEGKVYFPFYSKQLKRDPWKQVVASSNVIKGVLTHLIDSATEDRVIDQTSFKYSNPRLVNELCVEDKHLQGLSATWGPDENLFAEMPGMRVMLPMDQFDSKVKISSTENVVQKIVAAFKIDKTGDEVSSFCLMAEGSTRYILSEVYGKIFSSPDAIPKQL